MKKIINLLLIVVVVFCSTLSRAQLLPAPQNTYVILTGVLEWEAGLSSFDNKNRKDAELEKFFAKKGVPTENMVALYDSKATLKNMKNALETISAKAPKGSTIIFYYAGHGVKPSSDIYLANYDINLKQTDQTGFDIANISKILGKSNASNIILLADCCYSGGLIKECQKLSKMEKTAVVFTSATASNVSTGNWTFTQTLLDCLGGNPIGDHNKNGQIELSELRTELFQAMKYRERQLFGFENHGFDEKTSVSATTNATTVANYGQYFWAKKNKKWLPVRIVGEANNELQCEFYFYSDKEQKSIPLHALKPIHFVQHKKDAVVEVNWEGKWYKATVLQSQDGFCYIKYNDYDESWNEWVLYDRIRTGKEQNVKVADSNDYFPATILEEKDKKYYIHYKDYDSSWDEWVGADRIQQK